MPHYGQPGRGRAREPVRGDHRRPAAAGRQSALDRGHRRPTPHRCCGVLFSRARRAEGRPGLVAILQRPARACARTARASARSSHVDMDAVLDESKSLNEGAILLPDFAVDSWYWQIVRGRPACSTWTSRCATTRPRSGSTLLHGAGAEGPARQDPPHLRGRGRQAAAGSTSTKDAGRAAAAHPRAPSSGSPPPGLPGLRRRPAQRGRPGVEDRRASPSPTARRCRSTTCSRSSRRLDAPGLGRCSSALAERLEQPRHIGLGYLSLDRESSTLSGGESQRVKMVRHLGSSLTDITYVFDEPSVGLHPARRRPAGRAAAAAARQGQHRAGRRAQARRDRHRRPHRRHRAAAPGRTGGEVVYEGDFDGLREVGHADRATT